MLKAVHHLLSNAAGVTNLVGQRIVAIHEAQEQDLPYITFQAINIDHWESRDGLCGLALGTVQINCYDDDYAGVLAISEAVKLALSYQTGIHNGEVVHAIYNVRGPQDILSAPEAGTETPVFAQTMDFDVIYTEATA